MEKSNRHIETHTLSSLMSLLFSKFKGGKLSELLLPISLPTLSEGKINKLNKIVFRNYHQGMLPFTWIVTDRFSQMIITFQNFHKSHFLPTDTLGHFIPQETSPWDKEQACPQQMSRHWSLEDETNPAF